MIISSNPPLDIDGSIAIIFSSKNILNKEYGKEIDSFDNVIRFNDAVVDGYEKFVGTKTTLWVLNCNCIDKKKYIQRNSSVLYLDKPQAAMSGSYRTAIDRGKKLLLANQALYVGNRNAIKKPFPTNKELTTGLAMVILCVNQGVYPVIYGCGIDEGAKATHYWEKGDCSAPLSHDSIIERNYLKQLHSSNKVVIIGYENNSNAPI